jgi:hypothetical protein
MRMHLAPPGRQSGRLRPSDLGFGAARDSNPNRQIRSLVLHVGLVGSRPIWPAHVEGLVDVDGSRPVRRIVWMIKAHSILDRMAAGGRTPRQYRPARATPMACDGCTESQLRRPCDRPPLARPMYAGHKAADLTQQVPARRVATTSRLRRPLASRPGDDKGPLGRRSLPSHRRAAVEALLPSATSSARRAPCRPSARRGALRTSSARNPGRCGT